MFPNAAAVISEPIVAAEYTPLAQLNACEISGTAVLRRPPNPTFTEERLGKVTTPVLVINGSDDPVARRATRLLSCLPHARLHSISGVGHFDLPASADFLNVALTFLQEPSA